MVATPSSIITLQCFNLMDPFVDGLSGVSFVLQPISQST